MTTKIITKYDCKDTLFLLIMIIIPLWVMIFRTHFTLVMCSEYSLHISYTNLYEFLPHPQGVCKKEEHGNFIYSY